MGLAGLWSRRSLRRQRASYVGIVLLVGLIGGMALFALAGARRTQSAYPRFLRAAAVSTMAVDTGAYDPARVAEIAAYPEVARSQVYVGVPVGRIVDGEPQLGETFEAQVSVDGRFFEQDRFSPTRGRMADPRRIDEIVLNEAAAEDTGGKVGDRFTLGIWDPDDLDEDFFTNPTPPQFVVEATVVGIGVFPNEVLQDDADRAPRMLLTPAFAERAAPYAMYEWQGLELRGGDADVAAVKRRILERDDAGFSYFRQTSNTTFHTQQAVRPLSIALAAFGALALVACLVLAGQVIVRVVQGDRADRAVLRALGATTSASTLAAVVAPIVAVGVGVVLAAVTAFLLSPLMPIGRVRTVEVDRGLDADWTVLGLGALVVVVVLAAVTGVAAWRAASRRHAATARLRRSRVASLAEASGVAPAPVMGMRFALEPGRGATAVPVRSVIGGVAVAVVALVGAATFGSSLGTLVDNPRLFGWDWDATVLFGSGYGQVDPELAEATFAESSDVTAWSGASFGTGDLDGAPVALLGFTPRASVHPPVIEGRFLEGPDEIVLGAHTLAELGKDVGDRVTIGSGDDARRLRIVGVAILPTVGILHGTYPSLGDGAIVDHRRVPNYDAFTDDQGFVGPNIVFLRMTDGRDPAAARRLERTVRPLARADQDGLMVIDVQRPAEIVNADDIGTVPTIMGIALVLGALAALALALGTSVRRRRRDLALLKSLGFTRRDLGASVAWQSVVTVGMGLAVGVPVGILLGHLLWNRFADALDVVPETTLPWGWIAGVVAGTLVLGAVAAALPARVARRTPAAVVLRAE